MLSGCGTAEPFEESRSALAETAGDDGSEPPILTVEWRLPGKGVTELSSDEPVELKVTNLHSHAVEYWLDVELLGLRRRREQKIAEPTLLEPGQAKTFAWRPSDAPIQPVGTAVEAIGKVHYLAHVPGPEKEAGETVAGTISSEHVLMSYSSDYARVFATRDDDLDVRFASLATTELAARVDAGLPMAVRLRSIFDRMDSPVGRVDGERRTTSEIEKLLASEEAHSETVGFDGEWTESAKEALATRGRSDEREPGVAVQNYETPPTWCAYGVSYRNVCVEYRTQGMYSDSAVSSSVSPAEDSLIANQRATWTQAETLSIVGGTGTWGGPLDWAGCTGWGTTGQGVPLCRTSDGQGVYVAALVYPGAAQRFQGTGANFITTPRFSVTPYRTYYAASYSQNATFASVRIETQDRWTRAGAFVASVVSRPNLGLDTKYNITGIRLDVSSGPQTPPYYYPYSDPNGYAAADEAPYGEAAATYAVVPETTDRLISLGRSTRKLANGTYEALSSHTTQSKYTLGHELGHTIQGLLDGVPGQSGYAGMPPNVGGVVPCRCDYVQSGNQTHCLGSRHFYDDANAEGFAHHIAAMVMNQDFPGADCRFTYYKTHVTQVFTIDGQYALGTVPPPAPINCAAAYQSGTTTGWMRKWCPTLTNGTGTLGTYATERDWLTYLWSVDGAAPSNARAFVSTLVPLFKAPLSGELAWSVVSARVGALPSLPVRQRLDFQAQVHGLRP